MPLRFVLAVTMSALAFGSIHAPACRADALERMALDRLKATRQAVELLKQDHRPVEIDTGYRDYRAVLHAHSHLSHDSNGSVEEIRAAAKQVGVQIVMFSEHPAPDYDYYDDGHHGLVDGVLFIPGAEKDGLLNYPVRSVQDVPVSSPQERVDVVMRDEHALTFLSHLEERMDWELDGLTGTEIYNTHADFKDEPRLAQALRNPLTLFQLIPAIKAFPQETFASLQDYPADYLNRWDELCRKSRMTGVAANDSHHNQGLKALVADGGKVRLEDALGEQLALLDPEQIVALKPLVAGKQEGDTVFHVDLDPYERSFHHVSTHLLMNELTEPQVRDALKAGRAYVAFDWLADPTGFVFQAARGEQIHPLGSEMDIGDGLQFTVAATLPGTIRLMRDGREVASKRSRSLEHAVTEPGIYRAEVWLNLPDEPKVWILSNPIYVRGQ